MLPISRFRAALLVAGAVFVLFVRVSPIAQVRANDKAQICALEDRFAGAFRAKNVNGIMANYEHSRNLIAFNVVPRGEYARWDAYRKDWQEFLDSIGPIHSFEIKNLTINTDGNLGYSYSFQLYVAMTKAGKPIDLTMRVTDVYRRSGGQWLIVEEHVSLPVNLRTGQADLQFRP